MPDDFENLTEIAYGYDGGDDNNSPSVGAIIGIAMGVFAGFTAICFAGGALRRWSMDRQFANAAQHRRDNLDPDNFPKSNNASFLSTDEVLKDWVRNP